MREIALVSVVLVISRVLHRINRPTERGLEKMIFKDGRQDTGLVGEHLTYEVYRRAGIAAPLTPMRTSP